MDKCKCDSAEAMPKLQEYLVWLQRQVAMLAAVLETPLEPKPEALQRSNGGQGDGDGTAGWGNGTWP